MLFTLFIWSLPSEVTGIVVNTAKAYGDPLICDNALKIAQENPRVSEVFGVLEPIGKMALFEGYVAYSENGDSVAITVNVKGDRTEDNLRSKMDLYAVKNKDEWDYQKIQIRIKRPIEKKETIPILDK